MDAQHLALLDALDELHFAKDMLQLIEQCSFSPAASTACAIGDKLDAAIAKLTELRPNIQGKAA